MDNSISQFSDFQWLAKAFNSYEWKWDSSGAENIEANANTTHYEGTYDQVARDAFYSPQDILKEMRQFLFDAGGDALIKHLGMKEASILMDYAASDNDAPTHDVVLGSIEKGWVLHLQSQVFDYCDENYDLQATLVLRSNLTPQDALEYVNNIVSSNIANAVDVFARDLKRLMRSLPSSSGALAEETLEKFLLSEKVLRPVVVKKQKEELIGAIDRQDLVSSPKPKI